MEPLQRITRWLNLAEATLLLAPTHPDADYRGRILSQSRAWHGCPVSLCPPA